MASFNINTTVVAGQSLGVNEGGLIGPDGAILTFAPIAITTTADNDIIINGTIQTFGTGIDATSATQLEVLIGQTGSILSGGVGIRADVTTDTQIINHGSISGTNRGMILTADNAAVIPVVHDIINTGSITSTGTALQLETSNAGVTEIVNSGVIAGTGEGIDNTLTQDGITVLINTGTLTGGEPFSSSQAYIGGAGADTIFNTGVINGRVELGAGADTFNTLGGTVNGRVNGGSGNDVYITDSSALDINENNGQGNDRVEAAADFALDDHIEDLTLLGAGNWRGIGNELANEVTGNGGDNVLSGRAGNDTILGGAGDDFIRAGGNKDSVDGGSGDDLIRLGAGGDTAQGGTGDDTIEGRSGKDLIDGQDGNDRLIGGADEDLLRGGDGADTLVGGAGKDTLTGNAGTDSFEFHAVSDSPSLEFDVITDFTRGEDLIDLSALIEGQLALNLLGAFSGGGVASIRTVESGGDTRINIDVDGDGSRDMRIDVQGVTGLDGTDFLT